MPRDMRASEREREEWSLATLRKKEKGKYFIELLLVAFNQFIGNTFDEESEKRVTPVQLINIKQLPHCFLSVYALLKQPSSVYYPAGERYVFTLYIYVCIVYQK